MKWMNFVYNSNYKLSNSHIKMLKIILSVWTVIITILTLLMNLVFFSKGGYNHPVLTWSYIFVITTYINVYRFFSMVYDNNNQISLLQLKVWSMLFVRGVFVSYLYLSFYAENILGIISFLVAYLLTFVCNYYLTKAVNNEKQKN